MFLDVATAAKVTCLGRDTIKRAIRSGQLRAKRSGQGGKYLISPAALQAWFDGLEDA
jgi:excisionase family DNA binding protein